MMGRLATTLTALALASSVATAAPKGRVARAHFDRGVAAYTKGDYAAANAALAKSFAAEADDETLFALAQTERKLGHCAKAIELYTKLLGMDLPAENKQAVTVQIDECTQIIEEEKAASAMLDAPASAEPSTPAVADAPTQPPTDVTREWWKDPVGGGLVGAGVVGLAVGTVFLVQGSSADSDKASAATYDEYLEHSDRAESRGRIGVIATFAGAALVTAGIIWYVTRKPAATDRTVSGPAPARKHSLARSISGPARKHSLARSISGPARKHSLARSISGWVAPSAGGLALVGRF